MSQDNHNRKLTAQEAAAQLGYHPEHLYRLLKTGKLRGNKVADRVWLIDQGEVNRVKALQSDYGRLPRSDRP
jgi:excisionase family DNA binding protein